MNELTIIIEKMKDTKLYKSHCVGNMHMITSEITSKLKHKPNNKKKN